jgi:hypothetical protein
MHADLLRLPRAERRPWQHRISSACHINEMEAASLPAPNLPAECISDTYFTAPKSQQVYIRAIPSTARQCCTDRRNRKRRIVGKGDNRSRRPGTSVSSMELIQDPSSLSLAWVFMNEFS